SPICRERSSTRQSRNSAPLSLTTTTWRLRTMILGVVEKILLLEGEPKIIVRNRQVVVVSDNGAGLRDCLVELRSLQIGEAYVHARHDIGRITLQDFAELGQGGIGLAGVDQGETQIVERFQIRRFELNGAPVGFHGAG